MTSKNKKNLLKLEPQSIPLLALPFVPMAERKRLPRLAAIYFVLNAQGTVLYVGQSINLALRWSGHHRTTKLIEHQATRIAWLVIDDETLLDAVESACLLYFEPRCNRRGTQPATTELHQMPIRILAELYRTARFYLSEEGLSVNAFLAKQLEQYIEKREKRAPSPLVEHREQQAS